MSVPLIGPQFSWTFYGHAGLCLCGLVPLFSPERLVPYLLGGCEPDQCGEATGAALAVALQLYAALLVVQAKLLRHAAATPGDLNFHSVLAQAQGVACALSVGAVIQAEGTTHVRERALTPLTVVCTLVAARYGGGLQRLRWAVAAAPRDPREAALESEFQRGLLTEFFMLFPVPWLTRLFQAWSAVAFVIGGIAFFTPDLWCWVLSPSQDTVTACPWTIFRFVVRLHGALLLGQFWLAWKAARLVQPDTRRRLTESWAAVFTASMVIFFQAVRTGATGLVGVPCMLVYGGMAVTYWVGYLEPDVIPGSTGKTDGPGPASTASAAAAKPAAKPSNGKATPGKKAK